VAPATVEGTAEQVEQERVRLSGRIGARPRFSTTPNGVRRAEFNLAVHEDDESTTWHTVLAFRERAERLEQANPQKGQQAEVIGYRRVEERTDREGNPRTIERIIAAHIRLR
jgi:single-stranded DNA-binding protein